MKRILCVFVVIALVLCVGCVPEERDKSADKNDYPQSDAVFVSSFQSNLNNYDNSIRRFGKTSCYFKSFGNMVASIQYPETGIETLDSHIAMWIQETMASFGTLSDMMEESSLATYLTVTYDSYKVGDSIVGIRLKSRFLSPYGTKPVVRIKNFNFDVESDELLSADTVFTEKTRSNFDSIVAEKTDAEWNENENFLNAWLLTDSGMEVSFVRDGEIKTVLFNALELFSFMNKGFYLRRVAVGDFELPTFELDDGDEPMIALTFDDGPSFYTERLLDILDKHGVKGTFFVLGNQIDERKDTLKRVADEGHEIGSHSWEHKQLTKLSEGEIAQQILWTRAKIYETVGKDCFLMRPPYGEYDEKLKTVGKLYDVAFVNWSVDTLDWESKDPVAVTDEIMKSTKQGSIILCHDLYPSTLEAMELAIPKLLEKGYRFVTVSELMSYSGTPMQPGNLYYKQ